MYQTPLSDTHKPEVRPGVIEGGFVVFNVFSFNEI
jgi:hypothetical protein